MRLTRNSPGSWCGGTADVDTAAFLPSRCTLWATDSAVHRVSAPTRRGPAQTRRVSRRTVRQATSPPRAITTAQTTTATWKPAVSAVGSA
jgi:hypothetical protein